jgi:acetyl esterase/lipase
MGMSEIFVAGLLLTGSPNGQVALIQTGEAPAEDQQEPWQPGGGLQQIPLWPDELEIARPEVTGPETARRRRMTAIENVTRPTMTIYPPRGHNVGAALMVFPGGGYQVLAIDLEGTEICEWVTLRGITCVLLKYRVPQTWWRAGVQNAPDPQMALQDAERAMGMLRRRAPSLGIDPHKIGVLGFSAGGHLVTAISNATTRHYGWVDNADRLSTRPDFAVVLYPGHLWSGRDMDLYPFNPISRGCPPTFILHAQDDPIDDVRHSTVYFLALREAEVPVEMHIYAEGGHGFGIRQNAQPITRWPALLETWLHTIGIL